MGSVSPLLAIREKFIEKKISVEFIWVGTENGLEREILAMEDIPFFAIKAGKWRRYFSLKNFTDFFRTIFGFFQAIKIILTFKPDLVLSAGGFVGVPVVFAAAFVRTKMIIHQQDLQPGLANKIMARLADKITVSFEESIKYFSKEKTELTGNPVRAKVADSTKEIAYQHFNLEQNLPTLLVMGGSLGAEAINRLLFESVTELINFCQLIHIVGRGNQVEWQDKERFGALAARYHSYEYMFDELKHAYAAADLVVCRAGLSTLTELCFLAKPAVLIPISDNQQEENARYFDRKNAVVVQSEREITSEKFIELVRSLLADRGALKRLSFNIKQVMPENAADKYLEIITQ